MDGGPLGRVLVAVTTQPWLEAQPVACLVSPCGKGTEVLRRYRQAPVGDEGLGWECPACQGTSGGMWGCSMPRAVGQSRPEVLSKVNG